MWFRVPVCWMWRGPPTRAVQPVTANVLPQALQTPYLSHVDELPSEFDQEHCDMGSKASRPGSSQSLRLSFSVPQIGLQEKGRAGTWVHVRSLLKAHPQILPLP